MPPCKASTRRSTTSAARSQAPTSPPVSQAPPPPPTMAVGVEQFDLLVQQVRGLTKAVQAMQQQQQPQASVRLERMSSKFQNPTVGWAIWASRPVFLGKTNPRVESPQSDHDSTPGGSLPPFCPKTLETHSREDFLDRRLQEINRWIEELRHAPPALW